MSPSPAAPPPDDGRAVLHYVRSNSDGSEAEDVVVFRRSPSDIAVIKLRAPCTSAAFVTAHIDPATGFVRNMVGGRLQRDGTQLPVAWLVHDPEAARLTARVGAADAPPLFDIAVRARWHLYDFDFADLAANPPTEIARHADFAFDLPLLLVGDGEPNMVNRGEARMTFAAAERRGDVAVLRYRINGPAFGEQGGHMWFLATDGQLMEARIGLPNHSEYRDFHLRLVRTERGEGAWLRRIADHWQGCPG